MIIDTSAVIAILRGEPEAPEFARIIASAEACRISAVSFPEAAIVIDRHQYPTLM